MGDKIKYQKDLPEVGAGGQENEGRLVEGDEDLAGDVPAVFDFPEGKDEYLEVAEGGLHHDLWVFLEADVGEHGDGCVDDGGKFLLLGKLADDDCEDLEAKLEERISDFLFCDGVFGCVNHVLDENGVHCGHVLHRGEELQDELVNDREEIQ